MARPSSKALQAPPLTEPAMPLPSSYEEALGELEALLAQMESPTLPLNQLLSHYERGSALLAFCKTRLQAVEQQMLKLEEGQTLPFTPKMGR